MKKVRNLSGKSVAFIGDSIIAAGGFINLLREYFLNKGIRIALFNKGVAGNRVDMVKTLISEEFCFYKPDYAAIMFGGNDLGIWLYDGNKPVTEQLLEKRKERVFNYKRGLTETIERLLSFGITPIVTSPLCYNSDIEEKEDVYTIADNSEKEDYIGDNFYTKKTFCNINEGFKVLAQEAKTVALKFGTIYWDLLDDTLKEGAPEMFYEDGMHYNIKGHELLAKIILKNLTGERFIFTEPRESIKKIAEEEQRERAYFFVKYNRMSAYKSILCGDKLVSAVNEVIKNEGYTEGLTETRAKGFLEYAEDPVENGKKLTEDILNLN